MNAKTILFMIIALLFLVGGMGCKKNIPDNSITEVARIKYFPPQDNCNAYMVLIGDIDKVDAKLYKPENLSTEFEIDDMPVNITYSITDKMHNCGFGGNVPIITIHEIKEISK